MSALFNPAPKSYLKEVLCLACSRRPDGFCFAGKEVAAGVANAWIRPINAANRNAISDGDRIFADKSLADLLDVVSISMIGARSVGHHKEDHQIEVGRPWKKVGRATWKDVELATDKVKGVLWVNEASSYHGTNDKVSEQTASRQINSLLLIEPSKLNLVVAMESQYQAQDRRRVRAQFTFNGMGYNFVVTDPFIESKYFAGADGVFPIAKSRLCVSLPEVIGGSSTKLVASVITPERAG